jgi:hypothetical protein
MLKFIKMSTLFIIVLFALGYYIEIIPNMPHYALLYVDDNNRTYFALPCVKNLENLRLCTAADAYKLKYKPDPQCRDQGGFTQEGRSLIGYLLERIGLIDPLPSRWNSDGTWNW